MAGGEKSGGGGGTKSGGPDGLPKRGCSGGSSGSDSWPERVTERKRREPRRPVKIRRAGSDRDRSVIQSVFFKFKGNQFKNGIEKAGIPFVGRKAKITEGDVRGMLLHGLVEADQVADAGTIDGEADGVEIEKLGALGGGRADIETGYLVLAREGVEASDELGPGKGLVAVEALAGAVEEPFSLVGLGEGVFEGAAELPVEGVGTPCALEGIEEGEDPDEQEDPEDDTDEVAFPEAEGVE